MNRQLLVLCLASLSFSALADDWPNWRGPHHNGTSKEAKLPVQFSPSQGVKWSLSMPGPAASTPVISGNNVFITSTDVDREALVALCVDAKSGQVRWKRDVGTGYQTAGQGSKLQLDNNSNYASPSPVTDGKSVFFIFGNGDLAAFDVNGSPLWTRNLQKDMGDFAYQWTYSSSPTLWEGRLFIQILQRDQPANGRGKQGAESYVMALDPKTGKDLWKHVRPTVAPMESREAYSTPIPYVGPTGRKELLIVGGDILTSHEPATGKELWRWGTYNPGHREVWWRVVPTVVIGGGKALISAPKGAPVFAIKLDQSGDISESGLAWKSDDRSPVSTDVPTPAFSNGQFFVVNDRKKSLSSVSPADGKIKWTVELPGTQAVWGSPTIADRKVYLLNKGGDVIVLDEESGKVLAHNPMSPGEQEIRSTIAVSNGCLYVRTNGKLFCVGG